MQIGDVSVDPLFDGVLPLPPTAPGREHTLTIRATDRRRTVGCWASTEVSVASCCVPLLGGRLR